MFAIQLHEVIIPDRTQSGTIFLVTSYHDSNDMKQMFHSSKPDNFVFTDEHIKVMLYNLLCSVNFMHSANVVHRDLKPANILVDGQCNLVICDFGLSRTLLKEKKVKRPMTAHVTSRFYRAPELILDQGHYDTSIDMWSVGTILGDLMMYSKEYKKKNDLDIHLFKGTSCYPHSPCEDMLNSKADA